MNRISMDYLRFDRGRKPNRTSWADKGALRRQRLCAELPSSQRRGRSMQPPFRGLLYSMLQVCLRPCRLGSSHEERGCLHSCRSLRRLAAGVEKCNLDHLRAPRSSKPHSDPTALNTDLCTPGSSRKAAPVRLSCHARYRCGELSMRGVNSTALFERHSVPPGGSAAVALHLALQFAASERRALEGLQRGLFLHLC